MSKMIKVGMADLKVCNAPDALTTIGLGSCVGIALYDPIKKISGLAHIMLPDSSAIRNNSNIAKFADSGIEELVRQMVSIGASKTRLVAKIAGGAKMFALSNAASSTAINIGSQNVSATKSKLKELGIRILAEDCGLNYGRTVEFYSETGIYLIKAVGKEKKEI